MLYHIIASWIWFQFGALCSSAAGSLLTGLSVSSLLHICGEEMTFKQRQRVNGQRFAIGFSSGFGILLSYLSQVCHVIPDEISNLSQFTCQSKDNNNVGENRRI